MDSWLASYWHKHKIVYVASLGSSWWEHKQLQILTYHDGYCPVWSWMPAKVLGFVLCPKRKIFNSLKPHTQMIAASTLSVFLSCHASMVSAPHAPLRFSSLSLILLGWWNLCCLPEMPVCFISFYTFREQNTSQSQASWRTASHKICCISEISSQFIPVPLVRVKLPAQCHLLRPWHEIQLELVGLVAVRWTWSQSNGGSLGTVGLEAPHANLHPQKPFTRAWNKAHSHSMLWFLDAKSQLTRIKNKKLPSTLSPIYQQIIGSDMAPARHIPEKASVEPSTAQATLSSVAAVSHASIEDFKDALTWKPNPSSSKSSAAKWNSISFFYNCFGYQKQGLYVRGSWSMLLLFLFWPNKNKNHGQTMWNVFHDFPSSYRLTVWEFLLKVSVTALKIVS